MSIFGKTVDAIDWQDLDELLKESAGETVRLEFKSLIPTKDETLKKLSSFANTHGGYMIVGAKEDGNGTIVSVDGVSKRSNYYQTILQWCFDGIYPPIIPFVSKPIPTANDPAKVVYVIFVEESQSTPHFLNSRKGCFIRTDEHSQRFEPRLAELPEIEFLQNRRQKSTDLRVDLFSRAIRRFHTHLNSNLPERPIDFAGIPSFCLSLSPLFPGIFNISYEKLRNFLSSNFFGARGTTYPAGAIESQDGGFYKKNPRQIDYSYLELDINGFFYYHETLDLEAERYLRISKIFSWVIFYLKYVAKLFLESGYQGTLVFEAMIHDVGGIEFIMPFDSERAESARLDSTIHITHEFSSLELYADLTALLTEIARKFCFSCGHQGAFDATQTGVDEWFKNCLGYLGWQSVE